MAHTHAPGRSRQRRHHRAFTLVEMIVVVTIIALLAVLLAPRLFSRLNVAKKRVASATVKQIENAVNMYLADTGQTITSNFDLNVLLLGPGDGGSPEGPYFNKANALIDPWNTPYAIRVPGEVNVYDFDIVSLGPDLQLGTPDDITN